MPESPNLASSRQTRANWIGLRTLRQLPKAVGETAGGEPVYEVRSVRLLLDGAAPNFVRLAECAGCGRELAGGPVLTNADLDRPLPATTCTECIRSAGVSTFREPGGGEPAGERPAPAAVAANHADPVPAPAEVDRPERLDAVEGLLRAVVDRVNELGRVARAHQADVKERSQREEATAAALRDELAALRAATDGTGAELQRLAGAQADLARLAGAQAELQRLAGAQGELAAAQEAVAETLAGFDPSRVEQLIATRLAEAEGRLAHLIAGQWGDLEAAIEGPVEARTAGASRANEELAGGQAVLAERIDALAGQVMQMGNRLEAALGRLDALEATAGRALGSPPEDVPAGLLDSLDRQLEAAARRLAARSQAGAGRGQ